MSNYLELLKLVLAGLAYPKEFHQLGTSPGKSPRAILSRIATRLAQRRGIRFMSLRKPNRNAREEGSDWPEMAYTMVGLKRLQNVQMAVETVLRENIPGDLCECGVWRGGCSMLMRAVLKEHGSDRTIWAADSFEGLPKPDATRFPADKGYDYSEVDYLSVSLESVRQNFSTLNLLDEQVRFLKGWFSDTLPNAPIKTLAVLRADGDLYESTMDILSNLYQKISRGGFVIIDDYHSWEPCRKAVTDFREKHAITAPIQTIDWTGAYWRVP